MIDVNEQLLDGHKYYCNIIIETLIDSLPMQVSIQTEKRKKNMPPPPTQPENDDDAQNNQIEELQKDRKIKKLTQVNRELIERLKQQNEQLTKKINKQKLKPGRSLSVKSSPKSLKEVESTKKQLANAYKQIDMYKSVLTNLRAKQISIDSVDKINQLENKIKIEQTSIDQLQKQIKYLAGIKEQQEKQLKIYENDEVINSVSELQKQVTSLKEKIKVLKKNSQKRDEIEKKQHAYQIELERALRKMNDEYYPGKVDQKKGNQEDAQDITEKQWQTSKSQLVQLRKSHQDNQKKIDNIIRQKNKELKSAQQNELKIKQKMRKLQTLKSKLTQLSKLVIVRQSTNDKGNDKKDKKQEEGAGHSGGTHIEEKLSPKQKAQRKAQQTRQVKKWIIPQGYCLQKGKIAPDSIFFSDKNLLKQSKKSKIMQINIWHNNQEVPCVVQFNYQNQSGENLQGIQPIPNLGSNMELVVCKMKQGDYLHKIKGFFLSGQLVGIQLISKFGRQFKVQSENARTEGQPFTFEPRPNEIPSCVFGAYVRREEQVRICHLGFQFITDW